MDYVYSYKDSLDAINHLQDFMRITYPKLKQGIQREVYRERYWDCVYSESKKYSPKRAPSNKEF